MSGDVLLFFIRLHGLREDHGTLLSLFLYKGYCRIWSHVMTRTRAHTHTHIHGRVPLEEGSARLGELYRTAHNIPQQTDIHAPAIFEPAIPASERPQFVPYTARPRASALTHYTEIKSVISVLKHTATWRSCFESKCRAGFCFFRLSYFWLLSLNRKQFVECNSIQSSVYRHLIANPAFLGCGDVFIFNPLNTKRRLLYLKTQFVPRSKHFSSRL